MATGRREPVRPAASAARGGDVAAAAQPAARGPAPRADGRAVHDGHLRGDRRPHRAQARARALQPLLGGFLPPEFTVVGFARRDLSDEAVPRPPARGHQQAQPQPSGEAGDLGVVRARHRVPPRRLRRSGRVRRAREAARPHRPRSGHGREPALLPRRAAEPLPGDRQPARHAPAWPPAATERRERRRSVAGPGSSSRSRSATTSRARGTLNREIAEVFDEDQVYRIDHYLGKETVQNLSVFRFGNGLFEPIWNRRYIDSVQITVAETVGVEGRGEFYDETGALRDIVQNHGLQLHGDVRHGAAGRVRRRRTCATRSSRCSAP